MRHLLPLILVSCSCPLVQSSNGVEWETCPNAGCPSVVEVDRVEAEALSLINLPQCLSGVSVVVVGSTAFKCGSDTCLGSVIDRRKITLGNFYAVGTSSYLHELMHVLLYCRDGNGDSKHEAPEWEEVSRWYWEEYKQ